MWVKTLYPQWTSRLMVIPYTTWLVGFDPYPYVRSYIVSSCSAKNVPSHLQSHSEPAPIALTKDAGDIAPSMSTLASASAGKANSSWTCRSSDSVVCAAQVVSAYLRVHGMFLKTQDPKTMHFNQTNFRDSEFRMKSVQTQVEKGSHSVEVKRVEKSWEELGRVEKSWRATRRVEKRPGSVEKSWGHLRRAEKNWEELTRAEKSWEELGRAEKSWEELRRAEKSSEELRRVQKT